VNQDVPESHQSSLPVQDIFQLSPLVRMTLLSLYLALTLPLPFLARTTDAPVPVWGLALGLGLGWVALYAALSERVIVDDRGVAVAYPGWVPDLFRRGWQVDWTEITALKPRTTGQGGLVYYFVTSSGEARLLPMRVAGFARLVRYVQAKTGIDTSDVRPLSQPWMYLILLSFTLLLLLVDGWAIATALSQSTTGV
jgi:hypothetical protein